MNNRIVRSLLASAAIATSPFALMAQEEPQPRTLPATPDLPAPPKGVPAQVKIIGADREARAPQEPGRAVDKTYSDRLRNIVNRAATAQTLVIPKEERGPGKMEGAEVEDMNVMERILQKAVSGRDDNNAMGISIGHSYLSLGSEQNLYVEGYGAIFFLNVNYPLLPPPSAKEAPEPKENADAEWDEARREVRHETEPLLFWSDSSGPRYGVVEDYASEKVEDLKKNLLAALKNAAHIRALKPDETITVIVTGRGAPAQRFDRKRPNGGDRPETEGKPARLLVRARKSDAEAFLKDKLSSDEFRKRATIFIY